MNDPGAPLAIPVRFAFYGRVSTEDQQDPAASLGWQRRRAEALIEGHGEIVVDNYFDVGESRSLPWKRRPEASRLLADLASPDRNFNAIVIGEPQRAFYGSQFAMTFPVLTHHGVALWVPEVGGPVDPGSEAHDMVMSLYGGMSKGERNRAKLRAFTGMEALAANDGRFLGGRPPYGYDLVDAGPHPNPSKAADGKRLHRLEPNPVTAPVVQAIFRHYVEDHLGLRAIAQRLTDAGFPCPSAADPERNRHRAGNGGAWSRSAVRAILLNPRYTGHQVWGRYRGHEVLLDPDDVELGYEKRSRPQDPSEWVWSSDLAQEPIITPELFEAAQQQLGQGQHRHTDRRPSTATRVYPLRGKIVCATCGRKMEADWRDDHPRYRCRLSGPDYARNPALDATHPRTASLREQRVLPPLDAWLGTLFDPDHVEGTIQTLIAAAATPDPAVTARTDAARKRLVDLDRKLNQYRKALEAGADPPVVAGWMAEVRAERAEVQGQIADASPAPAITDIEIRAMGAWFAEAAERFAKMMERADPALRQKLYDELGLEILYTPGADTVEVTVRPRGATGRVGGGTCTLTPRAFRPSEYSVAA